MSAQPETVDDDTTTDPQTSPCTLAEADEGDSDRVMPPSGWDQ